MEVTRLAPPVGRSTVVFPDFAGDKRWPVDWEFGGEHGRRYYWQLVVHDLCSDWPTVAECPFAVRVDTPMGMFEGLVYVYERTWPPPRTVLRGAGPLTYVGPGVGSDVEKALVLAGKVTEVPLNELRFLVITGRCEGGDPIVPPGGDWVGFGPANGEPRDRWCGYGYEYGEILVVDGRDNEVTGEGRRPYKWSMDYTVFDDHASAVAHSETIRAAVPPLPGRPAPAETAGP